MQSWPIPNNIKKLRGFLGLTGYYRRFIKNFASINKPLTQLLKKNSFKWNEEAQEAFMTLKEAMVQAPVRALLNFNKPFVVETDASGVGLGAVLQQDGHPIAYMSKDNVAADALSRRTDVSELFALNTTSVSTDLYQGIVSNWCKDEQLQNIILDLKKGEVKKHYVLLNNQLLRKGKLVVGRNETLRKDLLSYFHDGAIVHVPYIGGLSKVDAVDRSLIAREQAIEVMKFHLSRAQNKMKQQANKNRPFEVLAKVGKVAYKLRLPNGSQIHDVFHVSHLKKVHGSHQGHMPAVFSQCVIGIAQGLSWELLADIYIKFPLFDS
ncbi:gypsy/ty3 retroelement polyprotein [Tanacetum coccineum]